MESEELFLKKPAKVKRNLLRRKMIVGGVVATQAFSLLVPVNSLNVLAEEQTQQKNDTTTGSDIDESNMLEQLEQVDNWQEYDVSDDDSYDLKLAQTDEALAEKEAQVMEADHDDDEVGEVVYAQDGIDYDATAFDASSFQAALKTPTVHSILITQDFKMSKTAKKIPKRDLEINLDGHSINLTKYLTSDSSSSDTTVTFKNGSIKTDTYLLYVPQKASWNIHVENMQITGQQFIKAPSSTLNFSGNNTVATKHANAEINHVNFLSGEYVGSSSNTGTLLTSSYPVFNFNDGSPDGVVNVENGAVVKITGESSTYTPFYNNVARIQIKDGGSLDITSNTAAIRPVNKSSSIDPGVFVDKGGNLNLTRQGKSSTKSSKGVIEAKRNDYSIVLNGDYDIRNNSKGKIFGGKIFNLNIGSTGIYAWGRGSNFEATPEFGWLNASASAIVNSGVANILVADPEEVSTKLKTKTTGRLASDADDTDIDYKLSADEYTEGKDQITGKYGADIDNLKLFVDGKDVTPKVKINLDDDGNYTIENISSLQLKTSNEIFVYGYDGGVEANRVLVTFEEERDYSLTVDPDYEFGDPTISGTYGADVAEVYLRVEHDDGDDGDDDSVSASKAPGTTRAVDPYKVATAKLNSDGTYIFNKADIAGKFTESDEVSVVALDENKDEEVESIYLDFTAGYDLKANVYTEDEDAITGTFGKFITDLKVTVGGEELKDVTATLNPDGTYSIANLAGKLDFDKEIKVIGYNKNNEKKAEAIVETHKLQRDYALTADDFNEGSNKITGTFGKDVTEIHLAIDGKEIPNVTANLNPDGTYTFDDMDQFIADMNQKVTVIAYDKKNEKQNEVNVNLIPEPKDYLLNPSSFVIGGDSYLSGTAGADVEYVSVYHVDPDGTRKLLGRAPVKDGKIRVYLGGYIVSKDEVIMAVAEDENQQPIDEEGKLVEKQVELRMLGEDGDYILQPDTFYLKEGQYVTGTYDNNKADKLVLRVDGKITNVFYPDQKENTFKLYGTGVQQLDQKVDILEYNGSQLLVSREVKLSERDYKLTANDYTLGKTTINGEFDSDHADTVKLIVNGNYRQMKPTESDGRYSIYALDYITSLDDDAYIAEYKGTSELKRIKVNIKEAMDYKVEITPNTFTLGDSIISGKWRADHTDISNVMLYVDGNPIGKAEAKTDGTFVINTKGTITDPTQTVELQLLADKEAIGQRQTVSILPAVNYNLNVNNYQLHTSYITGTFDGSDTTENDVVELVIHGKIVKKVAYEPEETNGNKDQEFKLSAVNNGEYLITEENKSDASIRLVKDYKTVNNVAVNVVE